MARSFTLSGFCYSRFAWAGRGLAALMGPVKMEETLEAAGMKVYPEAYFSVVGFFTLVCPIIVAAVMGILFPILFPWFPAASFTVEYILASATLIGVILVTPFIVMLLGYGVPRLKAMNRASNLDVETPFAGAYISVMATGGVAPYTSLQRLKDVPLLPNVAKAARDMDLDVRAMGMDPVAAIEKSARHLPSREYRELLLGYASTLRTGGDVIHYLITRTEMMFKDQLVKLKAMGERVATLMEMFTAITVLATISIYTIFTTSIAFEQYFTVGAFSTATFIFFGYILLPMVSLLFLYLADASQPRYPVSEWGPYKVYLASFPITVFFASTLALPFMASELYGLPFMRPFTLFMLNLRSLLGMEHGQEAALGLGLALILGAIPGAVAHSYYARRGKGLEYDISNFLRDLAETRKTGLSPEKCIESLATRLYGRLSRYLTVVSRQLRWGLPMRTIYETFSRKVKSWVALINVYLLVDAVEVGGGDVETLDDLAAFSEMTSSLEREKAIMLRPLLFIPYVGVAILLFSTIVFLSYTRSVLGMFARMPISYADFATLLLPPLVIEAYISGLVTGKMSSGAVSAGFKHAMLMVVAAIIVMWISPLFTMTFGPVGG